MKRPPVANPFAKRRPVNQHVIDGKAEWCPVCRCKVAMPCLACYVRELQKNNQITLPFAARRRPR